MGVRDAILNANDRTVCKVDVPEWKDANGEVYVRSISAKEQRECLQRFGKGGEVQDDSSQFWPATCAFFLCDEHGARLFGDDEAELLSDRNVEVLQRIAMAGLTHNKMRNEDGEQAAKNSATTPA